MRAIYTLAWWVLLPLVFVRLAVRALRAPRYWHGWSERLGRGAAVPPGGLWVHAVSVGEVQAVAPLLQKLMDRYPNTPITVTTTTPTGRQRVKALFDDRVRQRYLPLDLPFAVNGFLQRVAPALGLVVETEIWPNLYHAAAQRQVPLALVNARLSERSARGYGWLSGLSREALSHLSLLAAQDHPDAERFIALGAEASAVVVTGNIKFDRSLPPSQAEEAAALGRQMALDGRLLIAASTHEPEEIAVLAAFERVLADAPDCRLLIAPRHPERFERVYELCQTSGLGVARRSENRALAADQHILLVDTLGELPVFLALADAAFVGGSLVERGGHNILEPAALGVPVAFGPHMFNFAGSSAQLLAAGGAVQVADSEGLAEVWCQWLCDPAQRAQIGERALAVVEQNRGALRRLIKALEPLLAQASNSQPQDQIPRGSL